ncbi:MAG: threonylcarbamoyl-AMP synthase [Alphaproteobacteria bacterium]|nr:threonylcarbamoyl-AMP synthase [Alphaproteobacteria bacterium]
MTDAPILAPDPAAIARAAQALRDGLLVGLPTETVYGLAADATSDRAVAAIFAAKNRPRFNPLIVHVADIESAQRLVAFDSRADSLAAKFWPGPLTMVLPRRADGGVSLLCSAGLDSLAVRMPAHDVARAVIRAAGRPLAAPSANPSGRLSPTRAEHVARSLGGKVALVLDGGPCPVGVESTVVDLTGAKALLLRPGGIAEEQLAAVIGALDHPKAGSAIKSPGMLESHYAPHLPLRLGAHDVRPDEALLAFGGAVPTGARMTLNLSPAGDLVEAASHLFDYLHRLDQSGAKAIAATAIPERGLGRAINDRLRRAAAPR